LSLRDVRTYEGLARGKGKGPVGEDSPLKRSVLWANWSR